MAPDRKRAALAVAGASAGVVGGGSCDKWGKLEGMSSEVLTLVFGRMPTDMMARTVPFVCRAWRDAAAWPHCWSDIDIEEWCRRVDRSDVIDAAVRRLVRRSQGTLRRLSVYRLGNSGFNVAAISGKILTNLQIPMSEVTDKMVENHAKSLPSLTVLNISYCSKISSRGIELLGNHCKSLVQLKRDMMPANFEPMQYGGQASNVDESEALAISSSMPKLIHLEIAYGRFSDHGLEAILTKCPALHMLDIRGCWNVKMAWNIEQMCRKILFFTEPWADEYDTSSSDE